MYTGYCVFLMATIWMTLTSHWVAGGRFTTKTTLTKQSTTKQPMTQQEQKVLMTMKTTTTDCQKTIDVCKSISPNIEKLMNDGKYCEAFKYNVKDENAKKCLVDYGSCTDDEFKKIYDSACSGQARNSFSSLLATISTAVVIGILHFVTR